MFVWLQQAIRIGTNGEIMVNYFQLESQQEYSRTGRFGFKRLVPRYEEEEREDEDDKEASE